LDHLQALTEINLDDLIGAFGLKQHVRLSAVARRVFRAPARAFARQMLEFDENTLRHGLVEAARQTVRLHVRDIRVYGAENIPRGPVLVVSNHPGMTDTLVLFASLGRSDLHAIALARPFLVSLANVSGRLLFLDENSLQRVGMMRAATRHLRAGGALLTFPAGRNEPDPALEPGAVHSLAAWVDSAGAFVRLAPGTRVLPVCVRGVAWTAAARHPLARLRKVQEDRQLLASVLQLLFAIALGLRPVTATVQIGHPIPVEEMAPHGFSSLHGSLIGEMQRLMAERPGGSGVSIL
jgi:1-acyl-sn-glycerol-3-phosphate acyltransferase